MVDKEKEDGKYAVEGEGGINKGNVELTQLSLLENGNAGSQARHWLLRCLLSYMVIQISVRAFERQRRFFGPAFAS